jgi:RimJ/RimL family protein N-acetyltransferase
MTADQDTSVHTNPLGQPVGFPVPNWEPRPRPPRTALEGRYCRIEPFDPERHAADLFEAFAEETEGRLWTYMAYGPFPNFESFREFMRGYFCGADPLCHVIAEHSNGGAAGMASYMRIDPAMGAIEVGSIAYAPRLQKSRAATEAMYLMMRRVFDDLKYRRYEWKCDALNAPSRQAAERLGFRFEGIFRQAVVYKGRNRDTAWYSIIDREWPALKTAFEQWLAPNNFGADGRQHRRMSDLTREAQAEPG